MTPLLLSACLGSHDVVRVLIEEGNADVDMADETGVTALTHAANHASIPSDEMIGSGPGPAGRSRLSLAHTEVIKILIDAKADVNARDQYGHNALFHAVQGLPVLDADGRPVVSIGGHLTTIKQLVEAGITINLVEPDTAFLQVPKWQMAARHNSGCNSNSMYTTPLCMAAQHGYDIVEYLLDNDADPNLPSANSFTTLMAAVQGTVNNDHSELIASMLISRGAALNTTNSKGYSALMDACERGYTNHVKLLLSHSADTTLTLPDGYTALHLAVAKGEVECVQALLNAGANCLARTRAGAYTLALDCEELCIDKAEESAESDATRCKRGDQCGALSMVWHAEQSNGRPIAERYDFHPQEPARGTCCRYQAVLRVLQQASIGGWPVDNDPEMSELFAQNSIVQVHGLVGAARHNGKKGMIKAWNAQKQRYIVHLEPDEQNSTAVTPAVIAVRVGNLRLLQSGSDNDEEVCCVS